MVGRDRRSMIPGDSSLRRFRMPVFEPMAHILIAEDDESMRRFLVRALTEAGHRVRAVGDGIELARRAVAENPGLRIMFITGFAAVAMKNSQLETTRAKVLSKPFHLRDLVAQIDRMLAA